MPLDVGVNWALLNSNRDALWGLRRVLYVWCHPETHRVLYVGKADYRSVRQRFSCPSKDSVWDYLQRTFGLNEVDVRVGELLTDARLTVELLADTETLLIRRLLPCCNVQCTRTRISRPGLRVTCSGDWPESRSTFLDR